jgi:hypothetical protein
VVCDKILALKGSGLEKYKEYAKNVKEYFNAVVSHNNLDKTAYKYIMDSKISAQEGAPVDLAQYNAKIEEMNRATDAANALEASYKAKLQSLR